MGKGQISLFMIIGVVLLIILATMFFLFMPGEQSRDIIPILQDDLTPVQVFVQRCVQQTTQQALVQAGIQGGYIELPTEIAADPTLYVTPQPGATQKLPYWLRYGRSYAPSVEDVRSGVERYVEQNLPLCLNNLDDLPGVEAITEPSVRLQINERDITIYVQYTIQSDNIEHTSEIEEFGVFMNVQLKHMLETAYAIMQRHSQEPFLAKSTLDLMALDEYNIPLANIDFSCREKRWHISQIENRLQELLLYNIPRIRVQQTQHLPFMSSAADYARYAHITIANYESVTIPPNPPSDLYEFQHYYWDTGLRQRVNLQAGFRYLQEFPMFIVARPSENGVLSTSATRGNARFLSFLCLQVYKFTYDVSFPVEAVVVDETAFADGQPLVLRFALPVMIDSNIPTTEGVDVQAQFAQATSSAFCEDVFETPVNVYVTDEYRELDLAGVEILYECGGLTCPMGITQDGGITPRVQAHVPSGCFGGEFIARHNNIMPVRYQWDNAQQNVILYTRQLYPVNVEVLLNPNGRDTVHLDHNQVGYLTFTDDYGYQASAMIGHNMDSTISLPYEPATYNISLAVYTSNFLSGGYAGRIPVTLDNMQKTLTIHAYNRINYPQDDAGMMNLFDIIADENTYTNLYYPEWR